MYSYCCINENETTTPTARQNKIDEFNACFENIEFRAKNDYEAFLLAYDVDKELSRGQFVAFGFWLLINSLALTLIIMMSYLGISIYILNKNKEK